MRASATERIREIDRYLYRPIPDPGQGLSRATREVNPAPSPAQGTADISSGTQQILGAADVMALGTVESATRRDRLRLRRRQFLKDLYSKANVRIFLEPPRVSIGDGEAPSKGPISAPVTVVEFVDYQCPFCARAVMILKRVEETYKGKVRLVIRDFPLPGHSEAPRAAEAAACGDLLQLYGQDSRACNCMPCIF